MYVFLTIQYTFEYSTVTYLADFKTFSNIQMTKQFQRNT